MSFQKMSTAKFRDEAIFAQTFARNFIKKAEDEAQKTTNYLKNLWIIWKLCRKTSVYPLI